MFNRHSYIFYVKVKYSQILKDKSSFDRTFVQTLKLCIVYIMTGMVGIYLICLMKSLILPISFGFYLVSSEGKEKSL